MRKICYLIASSVLLSGCVTGAVVAGASSIAGKVIYDKRSIYSQRQDAIIERNFYNLLDQQENLENTSIVIKSINRNVLLVGYAENAHQKDLAFNVAKSVDNTNKVYNQIRIGKPSTAYDEAKDLWLTGRVNAALLKKKGIHIGQITIVVHNGTLYMLGIVPNASQAIATDVARQVPGIKKVITLFENA